MPCKNWINFEKSDDKTDDRAEHRPPNGISDGHCFAIRRSRRTALVPAEAQDPMTALRSQLDGTPPTLRSGAFRVDPPRVCLTVSVRKFDRDWSGGCESTRRSRERCGCSSESYCGQNYAAGVPPACVDVTRSQKYSFLQPKLPLFKPPGTHATASAAPAA